MKSPMKSTMTIKRWLLLALAFRLIAAKTHLSWNHPDEWFQTVEFGNFLSFGFLSQSGEFLTHMRNLTWPAILSLPMKMAQTIFPGDISARIYAIKITAGFLDLTILWSLWRLLKDEVKMSEPFRQAAWALFILPWFLIPESVRTSQEHLSTIACWWAIGLLAVRPSTAMTSILAGVAMVLTGAFRYPSFLFAAGLGTAVTLQWLLKRRQGFGWILAGVVIGIFLGGLTDWIVYGRPWESFWMYTQYNVLTGLSSVYFGKQGFFEAYVPFFKGTLGGVLAPLGIVTIILAPVGTALGLARLQPWAFALVFYFVGHALTPHKEPRFMAPTLLLLLWATHQGAYQAWTVWNRSQRDWPRWTKKMAVALLVLLLIGNTAKALRALWGETWRTSMNYLAVNHLLEDHPTCAIVTTYLPRAATVPWKSPAVVPDPALGFFPAPKHQVSSPSIGTRPIIWMDHRDNCTPQDRILFQPQKYEPYWEQKSQCQLLRTGVLKFFPLSFSPTLKAKNWISGPWYDCPATLLRQFKKQEVRTVIGRRIHPLPTLPPLGVSGAEYMRYAWDGRNPEAPENRDATFGDW